MSYRENWLDRWERKFGIRPPEEMLKHKQINNAGRSVRGDANRGISKNYKKRAA